MWQGYTTATRRTRKSVFCWMRHYHRPSTTTHDILNPLSLSLSGGNAMRRRVVAASALSSGSPAIHTLKHAIILTRQSRVCLCGAYVCFRRETHGCCFCCCCCACYYVHCLFLFYDHGGSHACWGGQSGGVRQSTNRPINCYCTI